MKNNIFTNQIFIFGIIIVLFVVVTSLIYWGKPLGSSDVMEIKESIEVVDSDKVSNIIFGPLSKLDSIRRFFTKTKNNGENRFDSFLSDY